MSPLGQHLRRTKLGMSVTAEILLDIAYDMGEVSGRALKEEAMHCDVGSPATLHGAIHWLEEHGYIKLGSDDKDLRKRPITVTPKGERHLFRVRFVETV
jgi:DNA-binding MarR family transcriptional regulator